MLARRLFLAVALSLATAGAAPAAPPPASAPASQPAATVLPTSMPMPATAPVSLAPAVAPSLPGMHAHHHGMAMGTGWMSMPMTTIGGFAGIGYTPDDCGETDRFALGMNMCMPVAAPGGARAYVMLHGNLFGVGTAETSDRARRALFSTNMVMTDAGMALGGRNMLNLDLMLTSELWTVPTTGYPELLQIGEVDKLGHPFIDAQHPHSSPIMGLTLSDTITLAPDRTLTLSFAPRGESTDGPIAFMHRPTGMMDPVAPLGHHIGQDVGHITSTVLSAELQAGAATVQLSAFHGTEPEPTHVDLPLGAPDSGAARLAYRFTPHLFAMGSVAYVQHPEEDKPAVNVVRVSGSVYGDQRSGAFRFFETGVWGALTNYDNAPFLQSFLGEAAAFHGSDALWARAEVLQRTPNEVAACPGPCGSGGDTGFWTGAATLGYTRALLRFSGEDLAAGAAGTVTIIPPALRAPYGVTVAYTGLAFLQLSGMEMWMK